MKTPTILQHEWSQWLSLTIDFLMQGHQRDHWTHGSNWISCRTLLKQETWLNHVTRYRPAIPILHPCMCTCAHTCNNMYVILQPPWLRITSSSALVPKLPSSLRFADASSAWTVDWSSQPFGGLTFFVSSSALCFSTEPIRFKPVNLYQMCGQSKIPSPAFFAMSMRIRLSFRNQTRLSSWNRATSSCSLNIFGWKAANAFWQSMECPYFILLHSDSNKLQWLPNLTA